MRRARGQAFVIVSRDGIQQLAIGGGRGHHLVVWQERDRLWATRVSSDGQTLDPDGRLLTEVQEVCGPSPSCYLPNTTPAVTFDGRSFVVAWRAPSVAGDESSLDGPLKRLRSSGQPSSDRRPAHSRGALLPNQRRSTCASASRWNGALRKSSIPAARQSSRL